MYPFSTCCNNKSAATVKFAIDQNLSPIEKKAFPFSSRHSSKIQLHLDLTIPLDLGKIRRSGTVIRIPEACWSQQTCSSFSSLLHRRWNEVSDRQARSCTSHHFGKGYATVTVGVGGGVRKGGGERRPGMSTTVARCISLIRFDLPNRDRSMKRGFYKDREAKERERKKWLIHGWELLMVLEF